jgi:hypothetical protein
MYETELSKLDEDVKELKQAKKDYRTSGYLWAAAAGLILINLSSHGWFTVLAGIGVFYSGYKYYAAKTWEHLANFDIERAQIVKETLLKSRDSIRGTED